MNSNIEIRGTYWTCKASIESEGYGDTNLVEPWLGAVVKEVEPGGGVFVISRLDAEGKVDDDSNASAYVKAADLFATKVEAMDYYDSRRP